MTPRTTSPRRLAAAAGVDERTIRRRCQSGEIRADHIDGRWIILAEDAAAFLETYRRYARKGKK